MPSSAIDDHQPACWLAAPFAHAASADGVALSAMPRRPISRLLRRCAMTGLLLAAHNGLAALQIPATGENRSFVALSDLHFDPFFDPSLVADLIRADTAHWQVIFERSAVKDLGAFGQDSSYPLLRSTLAAAAAFAPHPDFVLVTGDFLGHGFPAQFAKYAPHSDPAAYRRFVQKSMAFTTLMIRRAFPRTRLITALGNNDSGCRDYEMQPGGRLLAALAGLWQPLVDPGSKSFGRTFPIGGYFSLPHPTVRHLRVVVLNTVLFSPKYQNCNQGTEAGARELAWFDRTLREASRRGDKVWLAYHIPPGIDAYATLHASGPCPSRPVSFWRADYLSRFQRSVARFPGLVTAAFAGHTHMDEFRLPGGGGFIHVTPAVSPLFGNNPGFAVFSFTRATGELTDFQIYDLNLASGGAGPPQWSREYDFQQAFAQPAVNGSTLDAVQQAIAKDPAARTRYLTFYPVSSPQSTTDLVHWQAYWCSAQAFTPDAFAACYCPHEGGD